MQVFSKRYVDHETYYLKRNMHLGTQKHESEIQDYIVPIFDTFVGVYIHTLAFSVLDFFVLLFCSLCNQDWVLAESCLLGTASWVQRSMLYQGYCCNSQESAQTYH